MSGKTSGEQLLQRLLGRGDRVEVCEGHLQVISASGQPVPKEWLRDHRQVLIKAIVGAIKADALFYTGYDTGIYNRGRSPGVMLHWIDVLTGEPCCITFNADLTRQRDTKNGNKGKRLPPKQFRVGDRSALYMFWRQTGLPLPRSPSELWECMGNLKPMVFSRSVDSAGKLEKNNIRPLLVSSARLRQALGFSASTPVAMPPLSPVVDRQMTGNLPVNHRQDLPVTKAAKPKQHRASRYDVGAGKISANEVYSMTSNVSLDADSYRVFNTDSALEMNRPRSKGQDVDEWLADYDQPKPMHN